VPAIFINYRAKEQAGYAALLDRELSERFGPDAVFRDTRSIRPGADFVDELLDGLRRCQVLLAVMGPDWLAAGRRHQPSPDGEADWVQREIATALRAGIRVVPILVEDACLPRADDLPADIAALVRCQYLRLHHRSIDNDIDRLADEMIRLVPGLRIDRRHPHGLVDHEVRLYELSGPTLATRVGLITGPIRRVRCADVWVNSENTDMEMARTTEFSVSGIIRYWGARRDRSGRVVEDLVRDELMAAVGDRRPVAPGSAFVTGPGMLVETNNVRHVIHVAAVQGEPGTGFHQINDVGGCVTAALATAERLAGAGEHARTILFPLLGTGTAGADLRRTADALLRGAIAHLDTNPRTALRVIYFLAYSGAELEAYESTLRVIPRLVPAGPTM
jgi:hypothetical protein